MAKQDGWTGTETPSAALPLNRASGHASEQASNHASNQESDRLYEEFMKLFLKDERRLFAYIRSLLPQHADAEDVHQRCSLTLWRTFHQFDRQRLFLPWACAIAFNEIRNFYRTASRDKHLFAEELMRTIAEERVSDLETSQARLSALEGCLAEMRSTDRELIHAAYYDQKLLAEVAQSTGKALQTIYNRLSVLRRRLLECIQQKVEAAGGQ